MSYCAIVTFENGKSARQMEFGNAWGGAARIWKLLYDKYLLDPTVKHDNWMSAASGDGRKLWDLCRRDDLPMFERAIHMATMDWAIVRREHFTQFCAHLREFEERYPGSGSISHLQAWADAIEGFGPEIEAVGFWHTSVCDNPWCGWTDDTDEPVTYDLNDPKNDKHFEVYDELARVAEQPPAEGEEASNED
jgi:hypothetical protein